MFTRIFTALVLFIGIAVLTPTTNAQSADVTQMIARMQTIMEQMEALQTEFKQLAIQLGSSAAPAVLGAQANTTGSVFTESLANGETNDDIKRIQQLLATDPEIYPYGVASGFFGPKTEEAIRNLQGRFGLKQVGVIGPATTELLSGYMRAYPDGNYPDGVLSTRPAVLGASTSNTSGSASQLQALQTQLATLTGGTTGGTNPAESINVDFDDGEALIEIRYQDGTRKGLIADTDDEDEVEEYIARKTDLTRSQIQKVIDYSAPKRSSSSRDDNDENDAEDALDDADEAIDDADEEIGDADDDGDDVDWAEDTLEEAEDLLDDAEEAYDDEDWDEAVELAEEAEDLADDAVNRIDKEKGDDKGDSDDIDSIEVDVDEDESDVTVEYDDGNEYEFTVEEDKEAGIIEEIADELNMDEDDVEDLISFDYGSVSRINVRIDEEDEDALAFVIYRSGVERRVRINETDEDDIIEAIAEEIDEDEDDVEEWTEFD